jgi:hypothetical protein
MVFEYTYITSLGYIVFNKRIKGQIHRCWGRIRHSSNLFVKLARALAVIPIASHII